MASSKANDAEIYALDHRFEREMKSFGSGRKVPPVNLHQVERINALASKPLRDIRLAGGDARALKLNACALKVTSQVTLSPGG